MKHHNGLCNCGPTRQEVLILWPLTLRRGATRNCMYDVTENPKKV